MKKELEVILHKGDKNQIGEVRRVSRDENPNWTTLAERKLSEHWMVIRRIRSVKTNAAGFRSITYYGCGPEISEAEAVRIGAERNDQNPQNSVDAYD